MANVGEPTYAADVNAAQIRGRIRQTTVQTGITDNTVTAVTFDTEDIDTNDFHSTSSNTARVTPDVAGDYEVWGVLYVQGQTDYFAVDALVRVNGNTLNGGATRISPSANSTALGIPYHDIVTVDGVSDYWEACFRADRTGNGTTGTASSLFLSSTMCWKYLGA